MADADPLAVPGLADIDPPLDAAVAEVDRAAAEARLLPLLMTVVHLTGSLAILDAAGDTIMPQFSTDASGGLGGEREADLRRRAAAAIRAWRDAGCPPPYRPNADEFRRMIDTLAGKPLDADYVPLLAEELGFDGDERAFRWDRPVADADKARLKTLIVGAGLSGIVMGHRLQQAGIPFVIVEKNAGPGGTWFENRYPGARVDVPSHCYSFSFIRDHRWPELFSDANVLRAYFAEVAETLGLTPHVRYETSATRAVFDEASGHWDVTLRGPGGETTERFGALVSAVGQLNRAMIPTIAGEDGFRGVRIHTSRWPEGLDVAGRKVIVIGTAATALQLVPELAKEAAQLTVFQRSPPWVTIHPEYRDAIRPGEQWAIDHLPGYARWYRLIQYNWAIDTASPHMRIDPGWTGGPQAVSAANEASRVRLTAGMEKVIGNDPDLLAKLIPTYPPYVKRPMVSEGGFFRAFSQAHVHLVTDGAARFTEQGLLDGAGVEHAADIVVYATGFRALEYLAPMEVVGRAGVRIRDYWADEPRAYLGITVPNFPNLFLMYGPGTNLGFNGNLFFNGEAQAGYIINTLKWMAQDGLATVEVKPGVHADYAGRMDAALAGFTWSHEGTGSWYKNAAGKVIANSPWPLLTYWQMMRAPAPADFDVTRLAPDPDPSPPGRESR